MAETARMGVLPTFSLWTPVRAGLSHRCQIHVVTCSQERPLHIKNYHHPQLIVKGRQEHHFSGCDWLSCHYAHVSCLCSLTFPLPLRFSWNSAWKDCFWVISMGNHYYSERREARDLYSLSLPLCYLGFSIYIYHLDGFSRVPLMSVCVVGELPLG